VAAKQTELNREMSQDSVLEGEPSQISSTEETAGEKGRRRSSVLATLKSAVGFGVKE